MILVVNITYVKVYRLEQNIFYLAENTQNSIHRIYGKHTDQSIQTNGKGKLKCVFGATIFFYGDRWN